MTDENRIIEIKGQTSCPGFKKGIVKIVNNEDDLKKINKGDILVTVITTPAFFDTLKKAGAIVTDRGAVRGHGSIMIEELGKPCVVYTEIATQVLKDGDLVEVDATKGVVRVLKRKK